LIAQKEYTNAKANLFKHVVYYKRHAFLSQIKEKAFW